MSSHRFKPGSQIGKWVIKEEIGRGSFASVWKAETLDSSTPCVVAVKIIPVKNMLPRLRTYLDNEIQTLFKIRHENVIELFDSIETDDSICMITEFCSGGELTALCRRATRHLYNDDQRMLIIKQLIDGIDHLHGMGYVHRDIKPQNILINENGTVKIADFGFVCALPQQDMTATLCGSPMYMAPEILIQKEYNASVDIWSLGVVIYELFEGKPPFPGANCQDLLRLIRKNWRSLHYSSRTPLELQCLLVDMLIPFPDKRLTSKDLKRSAIFKPVFDGISLSSVLPISRDCPATNSLIFDFSDSKLDAKQASSTYVGNMTRDKSFEETNYQSSKLIYKENSIELSRDQIGDASHQNREDGQGVHDANFDTIPPDDFVLVTSAIQASFFKISSQVLFGTKTSSNSPSSLTHLSSVLGASPAKILKSWAQFLGGLHFKPKRAKMKM